jgi:hypothetical protein
MHVASARMATPSKLSAFVVMGTDSWGIEAPERTLRITIGTTAEAPASTHTPSRGYE